MVIDKEPFELHGQERISPGTDFHIEQSIESTIPFKYQLMSDKSYGAAILSS